MQILDFMQLSVLLIPSMLIILLPLAYFSGIYTGLRKMVAESEMDAIFAAGISRLNILKPLLVTSLIIIGVTYFISLYAMPAGRIQFNDLKREIANQEDSLHIEAGTFSQLDDNITIYVNNILNNQWMKNIIVYDTNKKDSPVTWTAEEGILKIDKKQNPYLVLFKGSRQEINAEQTSVLEFQSHQIDISKEIKQRKRPIKKKSERFLLELLDTSHLTYKKKIHAYKAEFYKRLLWPLAPLALMFIPLFFIFEPKKHRFGIGKQSIISIILAIGFIALQMLFNSQISSGNYAFIYLAIALPLVVPSIFLTLLTKEGGINTNV